MEAFFKITLPLLLLLHTMVPLLHCSEKYFAEIPPDTPASRWVSVTPGGNFVLKRPEPAGIENGNPTYVCKAQVNDERDKPGKLWISEGTYYCSLAETRWEIKRQSFELLDTAPGAVSWIPYQGGIPENPVVGGLHGCGKLAYVCRAKVFNSVIIGNLIDSINTCCVSTDGVELLVNNQTSIEVLVINSYGLSL